MTLIKTASIQMPATGLDGLVKGGRYWVSEDFEADTPANWAGIVLDSTGLIVGAANAGISVWKAGKKSILINSDGLYGYNAAGVATFYVNSDGALAIGPSATSGSGIMIDPDGVAGAAHKGFTVWKTSVKRIQINEDGMTTWNASSVATFKINSAGSLVVAPSALSGTGVMIDPDGIEGTGGEHKGITLWKTGVKRVTINEDGLLVRTSSDGSIPVYYQTSDFAAGTTGSSFATGFGAATGDTYAWIGAFRAGGSLWSNLVLQSGGGFVGIGLTNPNYPLHIYRAASNLSIVVDRGDGATTYMQAASTYGTIGTITDHILRLAVNASPKCYLTTAGKFGVGTSVPTAAFTSHAISGELSPATFHTNDFSDSGKIGSSVAISFGATTGATYGILSALQYPGGGASLAFADLILLGTNVKIGTSGTANPLTVCGTIWANTWIGTTSLAGTGNRAVYSDPSGWLVNDSSDRRLKKSIEPIPYGLDAVLALRPVRFQWRNQKKSGAQKEIGFIAQDIESIVPELIGINSDGMKSLDYPKITAVLCRAIQEMNNKIIQLQQEIR